MTCFHYFRINKSTIFFAKVFFYRCCCKLSFFVKINTYLVIDTFFLFQLYNYLFKGNNPDIAQKMRIPLWYLENIKIDIISYNLCLSCFHEFLQIYETLKKSKIHSEINWPLKIDEEENSICIQVDLFTTWTDPDLDSSNGTAV